MVTKMKKVKITTIILAIILVTLVAFAGVYMKTQNRMENKVKDYALGRELSGGRVVEIKPTSDGDETANQENYEIVKKTIEKRLDNLGAQDYAVSLNVEDGTIIVELAEDKNVDTYVYYLTADGKVQIKEEDTETELLSDSMVKKAQFTYTANAEGSYQVFLELQLTEDGQAKLEEIKNNYAILAEEIEEIENAEESTEETTDETVETENETDTTEEVEETTKKIAILTIADTEYDIDKIEKNKIRVKIGGQTTNTTTVNNNVAAAAELTMLIDSGKYPIEYEIENNRFVFTDITSEQMMYFAISVAAVILVVFIIFVIKYKTKGLLASISCIGYISILLLILRYTNVSISIEGIGAIILVLIINLRINQLILSRTKTMNIVDEAVSNTYKDVFLKLVPIIIITLVFCFAGWYNLSSFGMIMFWGLLLIAVYNVIVTKTLLKLKESK